MPPVNGTSTDPNVPGVTGENTNGVGVHGQSTTSTGVSGVSESGIAVHGISESGPWAIRGDAANGTGVHGQSRTRTGVGGISDSGFGIHGLSKDATGVFGGSENADGVFGESQKGRGVVGVAKRATGVEGNSTDGAGVYGSSRTGIGVHGKGLTAGFFEGRVKVTESIQVDKDLWVRGVDVIQRIDELQKQIEDLKHQVGAYLPPVASISVQQDGSAWRGSGLFPITGSGFRPNAPIRIIVPDHSPYPDTITADSNGNLSSRLQIACNPGDKLYFSTFDSRYSRYYPTITVGQVSNIVEITVR